MRIRFFAAVTAAIMLAAAPVSAADKYEALPPPVLAGVKAIEKHCQDENGTPKWKLPVFQIVDLSPDGVDDYVLETSAIVCAGAGGRAPWTGSGGSELWVWISTAKNRWAHALTQDARDWSVAKRTLSITALSAYCKLPNPKRWRLCTQTYRVKGGRLVKVKEEFNTD